MRMPALATTRIAQYLVAVALVGVAAVLTDALPDTVERRNTALFFGAVMLGGWRGGLGPGLLATALSALALDWFFVPPIHSFGVSRDDAMRLALFVGMGSLISYLNYARQSAEQRHAALLLQEKLGRVRSEATEWRYKALGDAAGIVGRARDAHSALERIAHLAIPRFAGAAAIYARAADGTLVTQAATTRVDGGPEADETTAATRVAQNGRPVVTDRFVVVPLVAGGRTLGAMAFVAARERTYHDDDLAFAQDLAQHAALVLASPNRH